MKRVVQVKEASGMSMSLHPAGPKFDLRCGACGGTWRERVGRLDNPVLGCPHCETLNRIPIEWE